MVNSQTHFNEQKGFIAQGYDVVAYFNNKAVKGNQKFEAAYNNMHFRFSSQENLNTFLKNPEKYIPQFGGYCAYAIGAKNQKYSINPETFEIRDDKLYLFYNAWGTNTLELWLKENPNDLVKKGDQNWSKITMK